MLLEIVGCRIDIFRNWIKIKISIVFVEIFGMIVNGNYGRFRDIEVFVYWGRWK